MPASAPAAAEPVPQQPGHQAEMVVLDQRAELRRGRLAPLASSAIASAKASL